MRPSNTLIANLNCDAALEGRACAPQALPHPLAFNIFSYSADIDHRTGYYGEKTKPMAELRRLFGMPALPISITCTRVPVPCAQSIALTTRFDTPLPKADARARQSAPP